jgi:hypothetical protein
VPSKQFPANQEKQEASELGAQIKQVNAVKLYNPILMEKMKAVG